MTGEMHESEVTPENYPIHFAIANAINGVVKPFDQYQGPYILVKYTRLWVIVSDESLISIFNETSQHQSDEFIPNGTTTLVDAVNAAQSLL